MAHHLVELVGAAEGTDVTVEQRAEIIQTILKVWAARKTYPNRVPGHELEAVFAALDMLGSKQPWRFSRLQHMQGVPTDGPEAPLLVKAAELERLTRETLLVLIWRACEQAMATEAEWLEAAEALHDATKDELVGSTRRIRRRLLEGLHDNDLDATVDGYGPETAGLIRRLRDMSSQLNALAIQLDEADDASQNAPKVNP